MYTHRTLLLAGQLALLFACRFPVGEAAPQDPETPDAAPRTAAPADDHGAGDVQIDPLAERILWRMGEYLKAAPAFEVRAVTLRDEPHPSGQWVQVTRTTHAVVDRERGVRASIGGDVERREYWCDLETAAMLDPDAMLYTIVAVPSELDAMLDFLIDEYGVSWPLADLLYSDPYVVLMEGVRLGAYVGLHEVDGTACHHLAFRQDTIDWQIWIAAGAHPVPRKLTITYRGIEGAPRVTASISEWSFTPFLPDIVFAFDPPPGAELVEIQPVRERESGGGGGEEER